MTVNLCQFFENAVNSFFRFSIFDFRFSIFSFEKKKQTKNKTKTNETQKNTLIQNLLS
jgi:hypothetical protein